MKVKKLIAILIMIISIIGVLSFSVYAENTTDNTTNNTTEDTTGKSEEINWTDASKATLETKMNGFRKAEVQINNMEKHTGSIYKYIITSKNEKPTVDENNFSEFESLDYDPEKKMMYLDCSEYMELNQDMYLWICEKIYENDKNQIKFILEGKKIERVEYPKGIEVFSDTTHFTSNHTQIFFNVPWGYSTFRKINLKIGKISDLTLLNEIQNGTSDFTDKLLQYAKNSNAIFTKTLASGAISKDHASNGYEGDGLDIASLEDQQYYFLYAELDDENGKYYPVEGVTLALANVYDNSMGHSWFLFFYGKDDFKWITHTPTSGGESIDPTVAPISRLPNTGIGIALIGVLVVFTGVAVIFKFKYKKYSDIK